jgi:hypothetical protein
MMRTIECDRFERKMRENGVVEGSDAWSLALRCKVAVERIATGDARPYYRERAEF